MLQNQKRNRVRANKDFFLCKEQQMDSLPPELQSTAYIINLALAALLLVSEILPFVRSNNYNGLLHFLCQKFGTRPREQRQPQQQQPPPAPPQPPPKIHS